jgi:hypothetical protein
VAHPMARQAFDCDRVSQSPCIHIDGVFVANLDAPR